ncbi:MAG: hypothetical protein U5R31_00735 [Acidimicrobiia bacterium]|nr:hypothetical protein [Acidimicrobiia bacterium]
MGDRVIVPWGLEEVEGVVVDTFGPATNAVVSVRIEFGDGDEAAEPSDIGFRADDVRLAAEVAHG